MSGGSHTNFNANAFTAGAVGGAGLLASAIGAGLANYRAEQERRWAGWNAVALRSALDLSEGLRAHEHAALRSKKAIIAAQRLTISRLESELVIERARSKRRS